MSKQPNDSFLPSGAMESPKLQFGPRSNSMTSPLTVPRSVPDNFINSSHTSSRTSPKSYNRSPAQTINGPPISPPKTRSASADESSAALVEDWRAYTQKLRSQHEGERNHMMADRTRADELVAEERALWEQERRLLNARIAELENLLSSQQRNGSESRAIIQPTLTHRQSNTYLNERQAFSPDGSTDGSTRSIPQESGRNADGTPFYAPAPCNPSRTFEPSNSELRVDSVSAPRESAIRVTSKEFTSSDFVRSPPATTSSLTSIPEREGPVETIDISYIQPELDGVPIKASAVSPTFAAKVLSPSNIGTPAKLSPPVRAPLREGSPNRPQTLEVIKEPENRRLVLHAGHTPNHSITKLTDLGDLTPRADDRRGSLAETFDGHHSESDHDDDGGDRELTGPLGFTGEKADDDPFFSQLVEKLQEAQKSEGTTPRSEDGEVSVLGLEEEGVVDEGPKLRVKQSMNFGRPLGSM